jgi:hypothetical protein
MRPYAEKIDRVQNLSATWGDAGEYTVQREIKKYYLL